METKGNFNLSSNQVTNFLGLGVRKELFDAFDFEVQLNGSLCPSSDKIKTIREGISFGIKKHGASASGTLIYASNMNGYNYTVEYNRFINMEFDINLEKLIDFEGNSQTVDIPAKIDFPLGYNHYDLDAETYKLSQAGYDAVLTDFIENVEPSRNQDSVKWIASVTVTRLANAKKTEITDEEAMLIAKHAFRENMEFDEKTIRKNVILPNGKRGRMALFIGLCNDALVSFDSSRDGNQLKMRAELLEDKSAWKSKNAILAEAKDIEFSVEMRVSGAIDAVGNRSRSGDYELEARTSYSVQALVKYEIDGEVKMTKVFFDRTENNYVINLVIGE